MHRDASLIVFYKDDKILLQDRRNLGKYADWGFFGGQIEAGETPEQAVVRETSEELSYQLTDFEFLLKEHFTSEGIKYTFYVFLAPCPSLSSFVQKEGRGMKLFSEEEALKLKLFEPDYETIKKVFGFLRSSKNKLS